MSRTTMANSRSGPRTTVSCHSGPGLTTLVLMLSQDQHGNAIVVLKPSWSSHTGVKGPDRQDQTVWS